MAKITIESSLGVKVFEGEDLCYTCLVSNCEVDGVVNDAIYLESEATYIDRDAICCIHSNALTHNPHPSLQ